MLSSYFKFKVKTKDFVENIKKILLALESKKILIIGEIDGFLKLNKEYQFDKKFDMIGFINSENSKKIKNIDNYCFEDISKLNYDYILITSEIPENTINMLNKYEAGNVKILFEKKVAQERENLMYLLDNGFEKKFKALKNKLKNKKVMLYGAGIFLELIKKYFDLSDINIIGISDRRFKNMALDKEFLGYKTYKVEEIENSGIDYLILSVKFPMPVWEGLYFNYLEKTKIKILPILKKNFLKTLDEFANL